jgi:hypothetical protein
VPRRLSGGDLLPRDVEAGIAGRQAARRPHLGQRTCPVARGLLPKGDPFVGPILLTMLAFDRPSLTLGNFARYSTQQGSKASCLRCFQGPVSYTNHSMINVNPVPRGTPV